MRCVATCALLAFGLSLAGHAQRSAARGGSSSHLAPVSRGGFSAPRSSAGARISMGSRPLNIIPGYGRGSPTPYLSRSAYSGTHSYRRPYFWPRPVGPYTAWPGWVSLGYPGYPDTASYYDPASLPSYAGPYDSQPPYETQAPPAYSSSAPANVSPSSPAPQEGEAVTLVFKDGRPSERIHNYLLTRTTLYVRDQHHRDIPLDQLDLAATQKVNRDAGVDFQLPATH